MDIVNVCGMMDMLGLLMSKIIGNNKITFRVSVFIMTLLIISCSTSVVLQDDSCKAPCWRNIEIGKTELEHTVELLNQMSDIEPNSIRSQPFSTDLALASKRLTHLLAVPKSVVVGNGGTSTWPYYVLMK